MNNNKSIKIVNLINKIENLTLESNKDDFIKNYSVIKEEIDIIDKKLSENINNDINYINMDINELYDILQSKISIIEHPENIDIESLKELSEIIKIIEEKIHNETLNIINIK